MFDANSTPRRHPTSVTIVNLTSILSPWGTAPSVSKIWERFKSNLKTSASWRESAILKTEVDCANSYWLLFVTQKVASSRIWFQSKILEEVAQHICNHRSISGEIPEFNFISLITDSTKSPPPSPSASPDHFSSQSSPPLHHTPNNLPATIY